MNTSSLIKLVTERFPEAVSATHTYRGDETVVLRREYLLEVARFLKEDPDLKHWEIALKVGHTPSGTLDSRNGPSATQRRELANLVARDLRDAKQRLQFVGQGEFPRTK